MFLLLKIKNLHQTSILPVLRKSFPRNISTSEVKNALKWNRKTKDVTEALRTNDKVPQGYELIYRAPMENYISWSKHMTTITAGVILSLAFYKYSYDNRIFNFERRISFKGLVASDTDIFYFAPGFVAISLLIRIVIAKYPLRIYKNMEKYIAVYDNQVPLTTSKHAFKKGDIKPSQHILNPWRQSTFLLGGRSSLLLLDYFRKPADFNELF